MSSRRPRTHGPPTRRNPPRTRPAPRRPDSPVTYALPPSESPVGEPASDEESLYAISTPGVQSPLPDPQADGPAEPDSDIELLDGPPPQPVVQDRDEAPESLNETLPTLDPLLFTDRALIPQLIGLDFVSQVDLLITEIHRCRPNDSMSAPLLPVVVEDGATSTDPLANPIGTSATPLFFIGVQIPQGRRVFVQQLSTLVPDHTLIERLAAGIPMLGRALRALADHECFFIGTTRVPVDLPGDYMNHMYGFWELGSWADLEAPDNISLSLLTPAVASPERTFLLGAHDLGDNVPLYILYIYHEDSDTVWNPPVASAVTVPSAPIPAIPFTSAIPHATASTSLSTTDTVEPACAEFLRTRFSARLELIQKAQTSSYGTAYRHCMQERHFMVIANALGLNLNLRAFAPVIVEGVQIHYDDIVLVAGLNLNTFGGTRTTVTKARDVRRRLARYKRGVEIGSIQPVPNGILPDGAEENQHQLFMGFMPVLDAMLRESDIDDSFLTDTSGSPEAEALTMKVEAFKALLTKVKTVLDFVV
ncbi:hypothetical protein DFH07DRAFT_766792 [Mycena maculata]|uniref:Uncharacterized protein n=1 Tax=Mycena maculata TaxID=230809 RepID=A0AAD7NUJ2_9AGAR|nr:hypothetical protein DFH07DRAFT_766792 [Mycena maculata]